MGLYAVFLLNVVAHWVSVMSGVVSLSLGIIEYFRKQKTETTVFLIVATVFLFVACGQAWEDEHRNGETLIRDKAGLVARLDTLGRPQLEGYGGVWMVAYAGKNHESSVVTVNTTITNKGAPSFAANFILSAHLPDGRTVAGLDVAQPLGNHEVKFGMTSGAPISYSANDYLPRKAGQVITSGGQCSGYYDVLFRNVTTEEIESARLVLSFVDVNEKPYTVVYTKGPKHEVIDPRVLQSEKVSP